MKSTWILLGLLTAIGVSPATHAIAQDGDGTDSYTVFVAYEEAYTRCGPSSEYYRADPLRHGQQLEVYVETEDGWLGVRPPENSFCWVPASTVKADQTGEAGSITEDRTVAWIGTHLGRAKRYRWQVQLAKGEPVTIIGRSEREGPDGPQLWYRIVPPSGEFRWVSREQIVRTTEELIATVKPNEPTKQVQYAEDETDQPSVSLLGDVGASILEKLDRKSRFGTPAPVKVRPAAGLSRR